jgi:nitrate reductase gamma subunit
MKDLFSPEALRAAAAFVIVLDQNRFGAAAFLCMVGLAAAVALLCRRPTKRKLRRYKSPVDRG